MADLPQWETVSLESGGTTERLRIQQGWLYRTIKETPANAAPAVAMVFVALDD